jgi:RHS repeat-associated protein
MGRGLCIVGAQFPTSPRVVGDAPVNAAPALLLMPAPNETWKVYYYAGAQLMAMRVLTGTTGNTLYYLHSDHLGSTSVTTSITGTVLARQSYTPYGSVRSGGGLPTDIGFTGQRAESGLGSLMFFNARFYSPLVGRFVSADSIVPEPGNPQSLNRYSYGLNNPSRFTDPSGHLTDDQIREWTGLDIDDLDKGLLEMLRALRFDDYLYGYTDEGMLTSYGLATLDESGHLAFGSYSISDLRKSGMAGWLLTRIIDDTQYLVHHTGGYAYPADLGSNSLYELHQSDETVGLGAPLMNVVLDALIGTGVTGGIELLCKGCTKGKLVVPSVPG